MSQSAESAANWYYEPNHPLTPAEKRRWAEALRYRQTMRAGEDFFGQLDRFVNEKSTCGSGPRYIENHSIHN